MLSVELAGWKLHASSSSPSKRLQQTAL